MKTPITREESPEIPKFIKNFFQINHISQVYKKIFRLEVPNFTIRLEVPSA